MGGRIAASAASARTLLAGRWARAIAYPPAMPLMYDTGARIGGVVFDLDGTLYDKRALERYMIRRLPLSLLRLLRYTRVRSSLAGEDFGSGEGIQAETLRRLARSERAQARWRRWIFETYDPTVVEGMRRAVRPYPGVHGLLEALRGGGLRLGLVSDYRGIEARLAALEIDPGVFDFTLVTELEGAMKPAPRMVERTLAGMGLPAGSLVMVGDRPRQDQRFAEAAGMGFVGVLAEGAAPDPSWQPWEASRELLLNMTVRSYHRG